MSTARKKYLVGLICGLAAGVFAGYVTLRMAHAHDGMHDEWYSGLEVPGTGSSCCNKHDCAPVPARINAKGQWEVFIDEKTFPVRDTSPFEGGAPNGWVPVPDNVILHGHDNPTGESVACFFDRKVRCFIPSAES